VASVPLWLNQEVILDDHALKSALEALLFVSGGPLSADRLAGVFEETTAEQVAEQLRALGRDYEERGSGIMLAEVAGGWQLVTRPENAAWIRKFRSVKVSAKLSRPALETLAIVAYRQPITRAEVESVRGVNIGGIMRNLMERRLVKIVGKKDVPGKPLMYGTTPEFLQYFGLKDLSALPTLKEFQELEAGEEIMEDVTVPEGETTGAGDDLEEASHDEAGAEPAATAGEKSTE
jgi:segregation and condensation protein B